MNDKNSPEHGYRHDISPYLQRPLRSFAEACRDIAERQQFLRRARLANDNTAVRAVVTGASARRGGPAEPR